MLQKLKSVVRLYDALTDRTSTHYIIWLCTLGTNVMNAFYNECHEKVEQSKETGDAKVKGNI